MASDQLKIEVISECFVRPEHEVELSKQIYHLGPFDLVMLSINPGQRGLLFSFDQSTELTQPEIGSLVERLNKAMSLALVHFYPLAGRFETIKYEDEHACWIFVDCLKGPGARLIHAKCVDVSVSDIVSSVDVHPAVRSFFDLGEKIVNYDGHTKPLLSIQVTELLDGVFIGFTMNHSVVDGTSFMHLVSTLSEIFRSGGNLSHISRVPHYKFYAPEGYGPVLKLPYLEPEEFIFRFDPSPLRERIFHFSPDSMARLKAKANEDIKNETQVPISSFLALSGLVWRSIIRARNLPGHENTECSILVNTRPRLDPPLSDEYFGNILTLAVPRCKVEELLSQSFGWAAQLVAQEVKKATTHDAIMEILSHFSAHPIVAPPSLEDQAQALGTVGNRVVIGGSRRFDMYGPEFGLGRAVAVRMGYGNKDNCKVSAIPGGEGGGSVDLEICLRPHIMKALEEDEDFMSFVS